MNTSNLTHRERLEKMIAGEKIDRLPVALWRHFPVDDQSADGLAAATINFQQSYDFDFVKITPASSYCLRDWGVTDAWSGSSEGTREYTRRVIHHPEDWSNLPLLDPRAGKLGEHLQAAELIANGIGVDTPVIQTIFSPLSQAKNLIGARELFVSMRKNPEELLAGLQTITETTIQFIRELEKTGISGIFFAIQHAQFGLLSEQEYNDFGKIFDQQVLEHASDFWLNVLHLHGKEVMFESVCDLPFQVINWHDRETYPNLAEAYELTDKIICGGLRRIQTLVLGNSEDVEKGATEVAEMVENRKFILGTGCVVPINAPYGNLLAARKVVESIPLTE